MFAATGSTATTAMSLPCSANSAATASRSLKGVGERVACRTLGDPGRRRDAERREPTSGAPGEQRVRVSVVAPVELHEQVSPGGATRKPDRAHRRLGAAVHEPHALDARHGFDDAFGQLHFPGRRHAERRAFRCRRLRSLDDLGTRVPEQQGSPRLHEVDVAIPVHIDEVRALASLDEQRRAPDRSERSHGRIHPTRDH